MANPFLTGESQEVVAYALLLGIAKNEKKRIDESGALPIINADAAWLLDMYRRCWRAAKGEG